MKEKIKVLVVDDAGFMRRAVTSILESDDEIEVVGVAENGKDGLEKVKTLNPDVITLDIDMPVMDGLTSIRHIMIESPIPIVVLSSLFSDGAITFEALRLGVVDFVPKPSGAVSSDIDRAKRRIIDRVKIAHMVNMENVRRVKLNKWNPKDKLEDRYRFRSLDYLLAVGTSLSGPNTVIRLLAGLSPMLPAAVMVVQEISPRIIESFARQFDEHVPWKVEVARDNMIVEQGTCYISSNEHAMGLEISGDEEVRLRMHDNGMTPLNTLFSSAAGIFRKNAIGLLLTGVGDDGANGFAEIQNSSGITIAQDAECCVYPNLTHNAISKGVVDMVLDENSLPSTLEAVME